MKNLNDYKEEIHKCSKCGLCQSVCPVYQKTGNDCAVSRGKFIMLNGLVKGDLKFNKNIDKYLDMCLKCNACKNFCPSGIDAAKIFMCAKSENFEKINISPFLKLLHHNISWRILLNLAKVASNTYRFFGADSIIQKSYPILQKTLIGKKIILANEFVSTNRNTQYKIKKTKHQNKAPSIKIIYFKGCVNEYINPKTKNATEIILEKMGVKVISTKFRCCGVPFLSAGNRAQFIKQAEYNLSQIPDEFDYFLTDCASCQSSFESYRDFIEDKKLLKKLENILSKSQNINEFVTQNAIEFTFEKGTSFTFHKPCHLDNTDFIHKLVSKSKNIEYVEMKDYDKCCGFAGAFSINQPELSVLISKEKAQNAISAGTNYIVTSCPSCSLGLTQGLIENSNFSTPINLIELIAQSEIKTSSL